MSDLNLQKYIVNFVDLDNDNASLTYLEKNKLEEINVAPIIHQLQQKGYRLIEDDFDEQNQSKHYFVITFRHTYQIIDIDHPNSAVSKDELQKKGIQTVHYQGAGSKTPVDSVTTVEFNRSLVFDVVENKIVKDNGWTKANFRIIGTPDVLGYMADKNYVGGDEVSVDDPNRSYTVTYDVVRQPSLQKIVNFVDVDENNKVLLTSGDLCGDPYTQIDYSTKEIIKFLQSIGYELIDNGFDPDDQMAFFNNNPDHTQTYFVSLGHKKIEVSGSNPVHGFEPSNYERNCVSVIHYIGAGKETPKDSTQVVRINRTLTIDAVTKEIYRKGEWQPAKDKFEDVITPVIKNFHASQYSVKGKLVSTDNFENIVIYEKNGRIIPVDENGDEILNVPRFYFETDPGDATKVLANESVPEIDGYVPCQHSVTPVNPSQSINVFYKIKSKKENCRKFKRRFKDTWRSIRETK